MAKRRVMHEQEHRAGTLVELLFEPRKALGTIATRVGAGRFGIEKQATALRCLAARLHKSVLIPRNLWETTGKGRRIIMVADHQHQWHRQAADLGFKGGIGIRVAPMGQIAGDDGEIRIPMFGVDTVHGQREAAGWVCAIKRAVAADDMGVGKMDKLHEGSHVLDHLKSEAALPKAAPV